MSRGALGRLRVHWYVLGCAGISRGVMGHLGVHCNVLGCAMMSRGSLGHLGACWDISGCTGLSRGALGCLGCAACSPARRGRCACRPVAHGAAGGFSEPGRRRRAGAVGYCCSPADRPPSPRRPGKGTRRRCWKSTPPRWSRCPSWTSCSTTSGTHHRNLDLKWGRLASWARSREPGPQEQPRDLSTPPGGVLDREGPSSLPTSSVPRPPGPPHSRDSKGKSRAPAPEPNHMT